MKVLVAAIIAPSTATKWMNGKLVVVVVPLL